MYLSKYTYAYTYTYTKQALDLYQRAGELGSIEAWRNLASA